ncbi:hypothetical protein GCM10010207_57410 [Streptomyces atratus]|nr:hypothetical protein GCM10010207_57410 [Streptomyces atratus]
MPGQAWLMPALATIGFAVNFWAWALLSPLGPRFKDSLDRSSFHQSLLVALPVVAGSLGRRRPAGGRLLPGPLIARQGGAPVRGPPGTEVSRALFRTAGSR